MFSAMVIGVTSALVIMNAIGISFSDIAEWISFGYITF